MKISTRGFLLISILIQIVWGLVPIASKFVLKEIPVELYIALRWTISGGLFAAFLTLRRNWVRVGPRTFLGVAGLGVVGYGIGSLGTLYGLQIGGVANFALISSLSPVVTSAIAIGIFREKPARYFHLSLLTSVVGLLLIVIGKFRISSVDVAGLSTGLILFGYTVDAFVFLLSKKYNSVMSTTQYLAITQLSAGSFMWLLESIWFHQFAHFQNLTYVGATAIGLVAVFAGVMCYFILYWLLHRIEAHRLSLFDGCRLISSIALGFILFKEPIVPSMIIGGTLIICGLIAGNYLARHS